MSMDHSIKDAAMSAGFAADSRGLGSLREAAARGSPQALEAVAQQFEALFLNMVLDSMRDASLGEGLGDSSETQMYQQLFDRQVAQGISQGSGLGFARLIVEQLSRKLPAPAAQDESGAVAATAADAAAAASVTAPGINTPGEFLAAALPHARRAAGKLGVDPMALVAQAALESGWGGRLPRRADGVSSFNVFGIKAGDNWQGERAVAHTLEFEGGIPVRRAQSFRAYPDLAAAFDDYARLIGQGGRYAEARAAGLDAGRYLGALQEAGYATDPAYAQKVGRVLAQLNVEVDDA